MAERTYAKARVLLSDACLFLGLWMVVLSGFFPVHFYVLYVFAAGVVLVVIAQVLVPFPNRMTQWRNARISDPSHVLRLSQCERAGQLPSNPTVGPDARKDSARGSP